MGNPNCLVILFGNPHQTPELYIYVLGIRKVIEKTLRLPLSTPVSLAMRSALLNRVVLLSTKKQPVLIEKLHGCGHGQGQLRKFTAHMIIDTYRIGHSQQCIMEGFTNIIWVHRRQQCPRSQSVTRQRFHRYM